MDNAYWIIIGLSLVLLLAPMQQASAIFFLPQEELAEEESFEYYKQQEIFRLEQLRNEIYGSQQNPYNDIEIVQKNNNQILDYYSPNSSEYFPKVVEYFKIVKQINLATQQLDEILAGKSITNSDFYKTELFVKESPKFLINNETSTMKRSDDNFQNYKKEQMIALEKIRNDRYSIHQENFNENVYQLSDEELKTYEKHLKNFETTSKKVKEQKQQANELYESQIEKLKDDQAELKATIDKKTKNYESQIKTLDKNFFILMDKEFKKYQIKITELLVEFNTEKQNAKTASQIKINESTDEYITEKQNAVTAFNTKINELTVEYITERQNVETAYNTKITELLVEFNTEKQNAKTAYQTKINELTYEFNTEKQNAKTAYQTKMNKLNEEMITSEQKIPKLIAIKLKNDERAIARNVVSYGDSEFTNLMKNEIIRAEKTRDNTISLNNPNSLNPYIIENTTNVAIIENANSAETVAPVETEKIYLELSWSDQNVVLELQSTNLNRNSTNFEDFKLMQAELAQMQLNKILHVENSENTEPSDSEQTDTVISDGIYLNAYDRNDFLFQFNKNMQKIIAEKKFIELFGNEIQNKDFGKRD